MREIKKYKKIKEQEKERTRTEKAREDRLLHQSRDKKMRQLDLIQRMV